SRAARRSAQDKGRARRARRRARPPTPGSRRRSSGSAKGWRKDASNSPARKLGAESRNFKAPLHEVTYEVSTWTKQQDPQAGAPPHGFRREESVPTTARGH